MYIVSQNYHPTQAQKMDIAVMVSKMIANPDAFVPSIAPDDSNLFYVDQANNWQLMFDYDKSGMKLRLCHRSQEPVAVMALAHWIAFRIGNASAMPFIE